MIRARKRIDQFVLSLSFGLARPIDDRVTKTRFFFAFVLPAFVCGIAIGARLAVPAAQFLSGMSIVSGVLLALCTLSYTRVKDLAGEKGWQGADPMVPAYRFARGALTATYISLTATALLIAQLFTGEGRPTEALSGIALGLVVHLGVRIWTMLSAIRFQVDATAGQRASGPPKLRQVS
ncbi:hypothetical protein SEA_BLINO_44 [Gordonia phage Blino]|uniref:Uncharacterized protein n=1 Tax=Gordonia phage Blino TaxID=2793696 RepID=A0A7T0M1P7_9CAUD|nr:hypothetical protein BIZ75_gp43 [Gordonia phage CarolAnn]YP_010114133.1 hypothetical protein KNV70_gp44 [Gordonia phage Blino]AOE44060.1 hypothetical protein SEA_CAROLANN_43 [Gordonia phage CarolAnn]QPL13992.1 hypothetical protein SEA_BLINO_44 [Gordonia phage Blino]